MNSAEYRTLREACGLSQRDAREFHGVSDRTQAYWESGDRPIPNGVVEEMQRLNAKLERAVLEAIDLVEDLKARHGAADVIALTRYRTEAGFADSRAAADGLPHGAHNALIGRIKVALERLSARVTVAWGD